MFNKLFNINKPYFIIVYFFAIFLDLWVKLNMESVPYRYFTKTILMGLLLVFYLKNYEVKNRKHHIYTLLAIVFFTIASLAVINHLESIQFITGMLFFILAKIMYCLRFTNYRDFSITKLIPFFVGSFIFMVFIFSLIYNNLGFYFIPVLVYFFVSLILFLFAYLRKNDVNRKSYNYVFVAMIFLLLSEIIMALKTYYTTIPFQDISVMLFYAIAQYLIVYGIIIEVKLLEEK